MYELIEHQRLTTNSAALTFSNIPQTYTDLYLLVSARSTNSDDNLYFKFNNTTSNTVWRNVLGYGSGIQSQSGSGWLAAGGVRSGTASTFTNIGIHVTNYTAAIPKSVSVDSTSEDNGSTGYQFLIANLWNDTAAVNRVDFYLQGGQLASGSSVTLYGLNRKMIIGKPSQPKAIGGNITFANGYWIHTFNGSGSFTTLANLTAEYLVIGGGGGGGGNGGAGGAGGYRSAVLGELSGGGVSNETPLILTKNQIYAVTVGAGGVGWTSSGSSAPNSGNASSFSSVSTTGGGKGGTFGSVGANGGSGGGSGPSVAGSGAGTSGEGFAGGTSYWNGLSAYRGGGGGGGAGGVGGNGSSATGGNGGLGVSSSITGTAVSRAGGGGGEGYTTGGTAVAGGGAGGNNNLAGTAGTANTGGGGGGTTGAGGTGGSGVVIIRYRAD